MSAPPLLFLYQTRTLLRCRKLPNLARSLHVTPAPRRNRDNDIPFAIDPTSENIAVDEQQPRGTITPTERQTFDRIFSDIAARGLKPQAQRDTSDSSEVARRATNLILEAAVADAAEDQSVRSRGKPLSAVQYATAARDKDKALLRFPPSLRAAASRAFELLNPDYSAFLPNDTKQATQSIVDESDETWQSPKQSVMRTVEVDAKRWPEQKRIENLMSLAKSDFELWDIMEREVFTYPDKLGLRPETVPQKSSGKAKRKAAKKRQSEKQSAANSPEDPSSDSPAGQFTGDAKMDLYVYGPLYPSFLLFGLRRLDTAFATPSPLALSVLPRIKELGLESFVLGVSTPFYNELLRIYFGRYGDLTNMMHLLEEMSHSGLYFDQGTASILNKAYDQIQELATGRHGQFAQALTTMPAYEPSVRDRIRSWHRNVDLSIAQRSSDIDFSRLRD